MKEMEDGGDSDAPEELTAAEGIKQDEEIRKVQIENVMRERRRQWALRKTQPKQKKEGVKAEETEQPDEAPSIPGMLPSNIVAVLATREKLTFSSDSEEEIVKRKNTKRKKKKKASGPETILLKDIPPPQCLENSLEFLKRRKMQVPRSSSILKNADQALRLLSSKGSLRSLS
ncbi:hypothetical protein MUK42_24230 [Musa troglodytarum]|uniref:Uncharacterized protein n=1 Tax=Musa troglodytarum TaxID=320322 RepID=A0A9E7JCE1_9LILI|nr:hypothetical protein MUK42_24230 [Musa troglodytarum]